MTGIRAAVVTAPKQVRVEEVPMRRPEKGEVQIRLDGCGLCGSDLALWEGRPWFEYPRPAGAPGHEAWGVVETVGKDVEDVQVGDRVAGLFHEAFAECATTDAAHVVPVPDRLNGDHFAGEPLACAANAVRRSRLGEGDQVVVVGVGFIGAAIVAFARAAGAEVTAVSRRAYALDIARQMGASKTLRLGEEDIEEQVSEATDGRLADVVFEVTGKQAPLDLATRLTRIRGTLVIAGFHQDGPRSIDMQLWNWRGLDVVNAHEREPEEYLEGMRHTARLVSDRMVDFTPLYTHEFPLERLDDAFQAMVDRPDGFLKAVIVP